MNKADYVQQLQQLGENPPRSGTIAELRSRITELREERGLGPVSSRNHTPLRTMMIEMNKASKKKGDLINYVEQSLGGHVTNNMTISQIQRVAVKKIYMSTSPSSSDPVGFGEHCAMTYEQLLQLCCLGQEDCQGRRLRLQAVPTGKLAGEQGSIPSSTSNGDAIATFGVVLEEKPRTYGPPELEQKGYPGKPMDPTNPIGNYTLPAASSAASSDVSSSHEILMAMIKDLKDEIKELKETQDEARPRKKSEKEDDSMGSYSMVSQ